MSLSHAPSASPPCVAQRRFLRSDDLDEVRAWTALDSGRHSRVVHGRGPMGFEMTIVSGAAVHTGMSRVALAQTVRGSTPRTCLHVARIGRSRYVFGREPFEVGPGAAIVAPHGWEHSRYSEPNEVTGIALEEAQWQREVLARGPSADGAVYPKPCVLDLRAGAHAALRAAIDDLCDLAGDPAASLQRHAHGEAVLLDALADALSRASAWSQMSGIAARRLADLEGWIDAHLDKPITLGRLCKVAGVGARSLQQGFMARRGLSPMRFVTERRLHAVHERLAGNSRENVSSVAWSFGFGHLGRFATLYRETYGETPSQTLRRCSGASAARPEAMRPA